MASHISLFSTSRFLRGRSRLGAARHFVRSRSQCFPPAFRVSCIAAGSRPDESLVDRVPAPTDGRALVVAALVATALATLTWRGNILKCDSSGGGASCTPLLAMHFPRLMRGVNIPQGGSQSDGSGVRGPVVLVPRCGKTADLCYFCEQGLGVVGIEERSWRIAGFREEQRRRLRGLKSGVILSKGLKGWEARVDFQAAKSFDGSRLGYAFKTGGKGLGYYADSPRVWRGEVLTDDGRQPLDIIQADVLQTTPQLVSASTFYKDGEFELSFDRGYLASLEPVARPAIAATYASLLKPGGRLLLAASPAWDTPDGSLNELTEKAVVQLFPAASFRVEVLGGDVESRTKAFLVTKAGGPDDRGSGGSGQRWALLGLGACAVAGIGFGVMRLTS